MNPALIQSSFEEQNPGSGTTSVFCGTPGLSLPVPEDYPQALPPVTVDAVKTQSGKAAGKGAAPTEETEFCREQLPLEGEPAVAGWRRYQTYGEFNRGSMGVIYKGFDTHLGREVALKFLHTEHKHNPDLRAQFIHEARITARLQHPGVVPVYELHQSSGNELFFTMKFVNGKTLRELLAARSYHFHDLPRFLNVFEKVCQTMAYAHASGVIHRDLKPANVMVGRFGVVRVMDWGLAKVMEDGPSAPSSPETGQSGGRCLLQPAMADLNGTGEAESIGSLGRVMGTLAYMSPEQARGEIEHLDKRADVFGLGAMLCEILTGGPPYACKDAEELYHKAAGADLGDALSRLDSCLADPQLVSLAKHCLRADPEERPDEAGAVAKAVTAQIESDVKRSALDLSRFFELSPDMFCLASLDGYFQRVNENFTRVLGFSKAELMTRPFLDFVHPEDLPQTLSQMEKLAQGLPVVRFRNRYRDVGGHYRWFEWTAKSIPEENVIFAIARTDDPDSPPWPEL